MKTHILISLFILSSCGRGFLPINIPEITEDNFRPIHTDSLLATAKSNHIEMKDMYFARNAFYAATSHPRGQAVRVFKSNGYEIKKDLCHADFPDIISELKEVEYPSKSEGRNFYADDLPFISHATDSTVSINKGFDYLIVYYWWNLDFKVDGRFNFIKSELVEMQNLLQEEDASRLNSPKIRLININCDNRLEFNTERSNFYLNTYFPKLKS